MWEDADMRQLGVDSQDVQDWLKWGTTTCLDIRLVGPVARGGGTSRFENLLAPQKKLAPSPNQNLCDEKIFA